MLSSAYQNLLRSVLPTQHFLLLCILVSLLQQHRRLTIQALATFMDYPITLESRRKKIQRFLLLPQLSLGRLWLPLTKLWLAQLYRPGQQVYLTIDRTDWRMLNILMVSIIFDKHALPLYFKLLPRLGNSKLAQQQQVLRMVKAILKPYCVVVLGDREFCSVKLAKWLQEQGWGYCLRLKKNTCIAQETQLVQLQKLGLAPGIKLFYKQVQVTRKKGFGMHNVAGVWEENDGGTRAWTGWYLLTSLEFAEAVSAYKRRWGIEVMFKNYKSGGYNLEDCHASPKRLQRLIIVMFIAYVSGVLNGVRIERIKVEKYLARAQEKSREGKRTSTFKKGIHAENWLGIERDKLVKQLLLINHRKAKHHQLGLEARILIQRAV